MEISLANISNANDNGSLQNQAENNKKYMDLKFFNAAVEGKIDVLEEQADHLDRLLTPRNNTILHIHILARPKEMESTELVKSVLDKCPPLLFHANDKGETPLHIAARFGHHRVVEVLMEHATSRNVELQSGRQIWRMTNSQKDTALHETVRMNHIEVVRLLITEDPDFSYSANDAGETPLYLAVERSFNDLAFEILDKCTSPAHKGPNGRTTLHAAVINQDQEMTKRILERTKFTLTREEDEQGWTPLHHCARTGCLAILKCLLEEDKSAAYIQSKDQRMTPLHIAIKNEHIDIIKELILQCPDSSELVDHQGRNVFHHATTFGSEETLSFLFKNPYINKLINDKDDEGNTPLHRIAADNDRGQHLFVRVIEHPLLDKNAVNNINKTPLDILLENESETLAWKKSWIRMLKKAGCKRSTREPMDKGMGSKTSVDSYLEIQQARESHLVVATLIATVTFAAGFTMPGGYNSEKGDPDVGLAILSRNTAFQAFIITDTIAMVLSSCAVFLHLFLALGTSSDLTLRKLSLLLFWTLFLTIIAMGTMVMAFAMGTYSVLGNSSGLSITIILISLLFFFFSYKTIMTRRRWKPIFHPSFKRHWIQIQDRFWVMPTKTGV